MGLPSGPSEDEDRRLFRIAHAVVLADQLNTTQQRRAFSDFIAAIAQYDIPSAILGKTDEEENKDEPDEALRTLITSTCQERYSVRKEGLIDRLGITREDLLDGKWLNKITEAHKVNNENTPKWPVIQALSESVSSEHRQYLRHQFRASNHIISTLITGCSEEWTYQRRLRVLQMYLDEIVSKSHPNEIATRVSLLATAIYRSHQSYKDASEYRLKSSDLPGVIRDLIKMQQDGIDADWSLESPHLDTVLRQPSGWIVPSYDVFLSQLLVVILSQGQDQDDPILDDLKYPLWSRFRRLIKLLSLLSLKELEQRIRLYLLILDACPQKPSWLVYFYSSLASLLSNMTMTSSHSQFHAAPKMKLSSASISPLLRSLMNQWVSCYLKASRPDDKRLLSLSLIIVTCQTTPIDVMTNQEGEPSFAPPTPAAMSLISSLRSYHASVYRPFEETLRVILECNCDTSPESFTSIALVMPMGDSRDLSLLGRCLDSEPGLLWTLNLLEQSAKAIIDEVSAKQVLDGMLQLYSLIQRCAQRRHKNGQHEAANRLTRLLDAVFNSPNTVESSKTASPETYLDLMGAYIHAMLIKALNTIFKSYSKIIIPVIDHAWAGSIRVTHSLSTAETQDTSFGGLLFIWRHLSLWLRAKSDEAQASVEKAQQARRLDLGSSELILTDVLPDWTEEIQNRVQSILLWPLYRVAESTEANKQEHLGLIRSILPYSWRWLPWDLKTLWWPLILLSDTSDVQLILDDVLNSESYLFGSLGEKRHGIGSLIMSPQGVLDSLPIGAVDAMPREDTPKYIINPYHPIHQNLSGSWTARFSKHSLPFLSEELIWGQSERGRYLRPLHLIAMILWIARPTDQPSWVDGVDDQIVDTRLVPATRWIDTLKTSKCLLRAIDLICRALPAATVIPLPYNTLTKKHDAEELRIFGALVLVHTASRFLEDGPHCALPFLEQSTGERQETEKTVPCQSRPRLSFDHQSDRRPALPTIFGRLVVDLQLHADQAYTAFISLVLIPLAQAKSKKISKTLWDGVRRTYPKLWDAYLSGAASTGDPPSDPSMPRYPHPLSREFQWATPLMSLLGRLDEAELSWFKNKHLNKMGQSEVRKMVGLLARQSSTIVQFDDPDRGNTGPKMTDAMQKVFLS